MNSVERTWRNIAPGVFLVGLGAVLAWAPFWQWVFVVLAGMSVLNALVKRKWHKVPLGILWTAGLSWSYATGRIGGWAMFFMLCGASIVLGPLLARLFRPKDPPASPPPRPGAGVVIDV